MQDHAVAAAGGRGEGTSLFQSLACSGSAGGCLLLPKVSASKSKLHRVAKSCLTQSLCFKEAKAGSTQHHWVALATNPQPLYN